jgi:hypothetical protein
MINTSALTISLIAEHIIETERKRDEVRELLMTGMPKNTLNSDLWNYDELIMQVNYLNELRKWLIDHLKELVGKEFA